MAIYIDWELRFDLAAVMNANYCKVVEENPIPLFFLNDRFVPKADIHIHTKNPALGRASILPL